MDKMIKKDCKNCDQRIVGGISVDRAKFPYYVLVLGKYSCGGSILNEEWVLSAAHCVVSDTYNNLYISYNNNSFFSVKEIIIHPDYNWSTNENDIALIRVDIQNGNLLDFQNTKAVKLFDGNSDSLIGKRAVVCGYGTTSEGGSGSDTLKAVELSIVDCLDNTNYNSDDINKSDMICAYELDEDSCQGDSGGPLVIECNSESDCSNNVTQVGIVSWGYGCARPGYPGVYTNVSKYTGWIDTVINSPYYTFPNNNPTNSNANISLFIIIIVVAAIAIIIFFLISFSKKRKKAKKISKILKIIKD